MMASGIHLKIDGQAWQGEIKIEDKFRQLHPVDQLDLLGDFIGTLQEHYDQIHHNWTKT
jgi:hypothetical protein